MSTSAVLNRHPGARPLAIAGIVGAAALCGTLLLELADVTGAARTAADLMALAGFAGFAAIALSLLLVRAGGGTFGTIAFAIWIAGSLALLTGTIIEVTGGNADNAFFPIGGLSTAIGGLLSAVAVARAGVLTGWRRWSMTVLAVFYTGLVVLNIVNGDNWDEPLAQLGWPLLAIAVAVSALTQTTESPENG